MTEHHQHSKKQLQSIVTHPRTEQLFMTLISFFLAFLSVALIIIVLQNAGFDISMDQLYRYGVRDIIFTSSGLANTLYWTTPLIFTGLSVGIAFRAGLFNIGSQGQMAMGAVSAAIWAATIVPNTTFLTFLAKSPLNLVITMFIGGIVGGLWGYIPGKLKANFGAHEVITTILMNLVATNMLQFLVGSRTYSPFVNRSSVDAYGQTEVIVKSAKIEPINPSVSNFLNYSIFIALVIAIVMHIVLFRTRFGYRLRATGLNPTAAEASGINTKKMTIQAMVLSGALAGIGGALLVQGTFPYRYNLGMESTLGFEGIAVALLAQNAPLPIIIASLFFGYLHQSKVNLDVNTDIPADLIFVFQALVILFASSPYLARLLYRRMILDKTAKNKSSMLQSNQQEEES